MSISKVSLFMAFIMTARGSYRVGARIHKIQIFLNISICLDGSDTRQICLLPPCLPYLFCMSSLSYSYGSDTEGIGNRYRVNTEGTTPGEEVKHAVK